MAQDLDHAKTIPHFLQTKFVLLLLLFSDLAKLYKLLRHIPRGLQAMIMELEEHITKTG